MKCLKLIIMKSNPKLLDSSSSLQNARWGLVNQSLISSIKGISTANNLFEFFTHQSKLLLENYLKLCQTEHQSFLQNYRTLKENKGNKGLSNSVVALAAFLWAEHQDKVNIEHLSIFKYFWASGQTRNLVCLK